MQSATPKRLPKVVMPNCSTEKIYISSVHYVIPWAGHDDDV